MLIENFRPGTLEAMGLGPDILHRRNPGLIIVRVSGWGQDGPYRDRPGFGTLVESMSGYAARTGFADREPALPPTALADMVAGLYGAMAVLVALREVEAKGGKGQVIDLPLLDPLFSFIATEAAIYRLTGEVRERTGSRSETTSPRNVFRTKDGRYIGISASIQAMAERLFRAIGRADMIADPRFRTNTDRVRNAEACEAPIAAFIAARTLAENMAVFERAEVTAAPVYDIDQFMADPHVIAREILVDLPDTRDGASADAQRDPPPLRDTRPAAPPGAGPGRAHRRDPGLHSGSTARRSTGSRATASSVSPEICHDHRNPAGVALAAVRAGDRQALCRRCRPARCRRDHSRPRGQRCGLGKGAGPRAGARGGRDRVARRCRCRGPRQPAVAAVRARYRGGGRTPRIGAGTAQSRQRGACADGRRDHRRARSRARHGAGHDAP